jgi:predicted MFS family arabinose efflux permease
MSSSQSVWIVTAKDLIAIIVTPVFGYMAGVWHKGRVLTAGAVCMLFGNFLFLVPQFATGVYELGASQGDGLCGK